METLEWNDFKLAWHLQQMRTIIQQGIRNVGEMSVMRGEDCRDSWKYSVHYRLIVVLSSAVYIFKHLKCFQETNKVFKRMFCDKVFHVYLMPLIKMTNIYFCNHIFSHTFSLQAHWMAVQFRRGIELQSYVGLLLGFASRRSCCPLLCHISALRCILMYWNID